MKKAYLLLISFFTLHSIQGQINNYFNFQGLILNENGEELTNKQVELMISTTEDEEGNLVAYSERHNTTTNDIGVFDISIGQGNPTTASFDQVQWLDYVPYIQIEYRLNDNSEWKAIDPVKFHSVPFCLYSEKIVCQPGTPAIGKPGPQGSIGPGGAWASPGPQGPAGPPGELGCLRMTDSIPTEDLTTGMVYLDDGTNRGDGIPGFRYYDEITGWIDL